MGIDVWVSRKNPTAANRVLAIVEMDKQEYISSYFDDSEWQTLQQEVAECQQCSLCESRKQTVFGTGKQTADWLVIGEAPGQSEDEQGTPFVGKAGLLLTEMLRAIGLARDSVYITNILKCRPPGNRDPNPDEIKQCRPYLERQKQLINPKMILAVGRISAQTLLNTDAPLAKLRGKVHDLDGIPLVVIYHPAYLLRSPLEKRKAWQDMQLAHLAFLETIQHDARLAGQN
jgi:DNA polymerase